MNIHTALLQGQKLFEQSKISAPRLTAEVLLAHAIGCERVWLYAHPEEDLRELWWIHYGRYLHERLQGKPTQYITGHAEFFGRDFHVSPDVLIPRPETEHTIEAALELAAGAKRILDIGTGSGAIAITLALETGTPTAATDISEAAVRMAKANAQRLGAAVEFVTCDLGSALRDGTFDLIVSNPPYVPEVRATSLQREVRDYEPHIALFGGPDGLDVYRRLIPDALRLLQPGGRLILEIGWLEAGEIGAMLAPWEAVETRSDLAGIPRVMSAVKPATARQ
ncbi:MAG TPA: peptide chain release factor N(5)-glutamine methyltransferase [Bryobacteraceae bacterium]|nr:peptide chain release factor N(5)-glutamine methyltransferase [Bryobacteraceae bacterium]